MTDQLGGGLNFVNSGDPTGVAIGYWGSAYRCGFAGNTQNAVGGFASPLGPFNEETGLYCDSFSPTPEGICTLSSEGFIFPASNFLAPHYLRKKPNFSKKEKKCFSLLHPVFCF